MSHANTQNSSASANLHSQPLPPRPSGPPAEDTIYPNDIHYTSPFTSSPFELLYLVNTGKHDKVLQRGTMASPILQITIDGLICLREQHATLNQIVQETNVYSANLAFNATAGAAGGLILEGPMMPRTDNTGSFAGDICDADPNSLEFWMAHLTYAEQI
uniref:Uncharacterized protein n=1 Tax=Moniliophthora roreri TaxID=221103 RepID=A0A0W0FDQ3_MONRR